MLTPMLVEDPGDIVMLTTLMMMVFQSVLCRNGSVHQPAHQAAQEQLRRERVLPRKNAGQEHAWRPQAQGERNRVAGRGGRELLRSLPFIALRPTYSYEETTIAMLHENYHKGVRCELDHFRVYSFLQAA